MRLYVCACVVHMCACEWTCMNVHLEARYQQRVSSTSTFTWSFEIKSLAEPRIYQMARLASSENLLAFMPSHLHPTSLKLGLQISTTMFCLNVGNRDSNSVPLAFQACTYKVSPLPATKASIPVISRSIPRWAYLIPTPLCLSGFKNILTVLKGCYVPHQPPRGWHSFVGWNEDLTGPDSGQQDAFLVISSRLCKAQTSQRRLG